MTKREADMVISKGHPMTIEGKAMGKELRTTMTLPEKAIMIKGLNLVIQLDTPSMSLTTTIRKTHTRVSTTQVIKLNYFVIIVNNLVILRENALNQGKVDTLTG